MALTDVGVVTNSGIKSQCENAVLETSRWVGNFQHQRHCIHLRCGATDIKEYNCL